MIEFSPWFLVHLANFLILLTLLYFLLFKPVLRLLKERSDRISNSLEEAKMLRKRGEEAISELNKEISTAKEKARSLFLELQKEGLDEQKNILEKAKNKSLEMMEKARLKLREDTEKARALLREEASRLSLEIAKKVLGRELR